jgi:hypothetical protein
MRAEASTNSHAWWRQFSLLALMAGVTVFCVVCALIVIPPLLALACVVIYVLLTGVLAISLWYGRGWLRAFAVGATLPHISGYLMALSSPHPWGWVFLFIVFVIVSCVAGTASAVLHGYLVRRNGRLPIPDVPLIRNWFSNDDPRETGQG